MTNYEWIALVLLWIQILYGGITSFLYYKRRHLHPLSARNPVFYFLHQLGNSLVVINLTSWILNGYQGTCLGYHWSITCMDILALSPYFIRMFQCFFRYKMTCELMKHHMEKDLMSPKETPALGWYSQHQSWVSQKRLFMGLIILWSSALPLCILLTVSLPQVNFQTSVLDPLCPFAYSARHNPFFVILTFFLVGFTCILSFKLHEIEEGYWIKKEFIMVILCSSPICVLFSSHINVKREIEAFALIAMVIGFTTASFTIPIYLSYKHDDPQIQRKRRRHATNSPSQTQTLESHLPRLEIYLQNEKQYTGFWKFLAKEFAVESLVFWKDVQGIRKFAQEKDHENQNLDNSVSGHVVSVNLTLDGAFIPSSNVTIYQMLLLVVDTYISEQATQLINISARQRQEIMKKSKLLSPQSVITLDEIDNIFNPAIKEILGMLECGAWVRYTKSDYFFLAQSNDDTQFCPAPSEIHPSPISSPLSSPREVQPEPSPSASASGLAERSMVFPSVSGKERGFSFQSDHGLPNVAEGTIAEETEMTPFTSQPLFQG